MTCIDQLNFESFAIELCTSEYAFRFHMTCIDQLNFKSFAIEL